MKFASYLPLTCLCLHACSAENLGPFHSQAVHQKVQQRAGDPWQSVPEALLSAISSIQTRSDHISAASAFNTGLSGGEYASVTLGDDGRFPPVTETAPPPWWTDVSSEVQSQVLWEQSVIPALGSSILRDLLTAESTNAITELQTLNIETTEITVPVSGLPTTPGMATVTETSIPETFTGIVTGLPISSIGTADTTIRISGLPTTATMTTVSGTNLIGTVDIPATVPTSRKTATITDISTITGTATTIVSMDITRLVLHDGDSTKTITINPAPNCQAAATSQSNTAVRMGTAEFGFAGIVAAILGVVAAQ